MRELTNEEFALVAGGVAAESEERHWWNDAFDWLSSSLSWLGDTTGGWLGQYLNGFGDVAEGMNGNADELWERAGGYNDYCIDQQSNGEECLPFDQWVDGGG